MINNLTGAGVCVNSAACNEFIFKEYGFGYFNNFQLKKSWSIFSLKLDNSHFLILLFIYY